MLIIQAQDAGKIKRRNVLKLDGKINEKLRKFVCQSAPQYQRQLPECIQLQARGDR